MKKRFLATVMAVGVVLGMTACTGSQTPSTTAAETTKAAAGSEAATTKGSEAASSEAASTWKPTTTVSIVVPAGAGGNTDLSARVFAEYAKRMTGADFIVVNANGAAGSVAANQVRSAAADGHTFLYGHNLVNVANIAGVTDYNCKDYLEAGQFVCLGAPTKERYEIIKDIPTLTEQGVDLVYPNCEFSFYFPKDTSDDVIAWYDQLVKKMTEDPEVKEAIAKVEMMPYYLSSTDSEANDEKIYNEIKQIADDLAK